MRNLRSVSESELSGRSTTFLAIRSPLQRTRATTRSGDANQPGCSRPVRTRSPPSSRTHLPSLEIRIREQAPAPIPKAYRRTINEAFASSSAHPVSRTHHGTGKTLTATIATVCMVTSTAARMREVPIGTSINSVSAIDSIMFCYHAGRYGRND